jgi:hypothetical protein
MARIAELFGAKVDVTPASSIHEHWQNRHCPFTNSICDVTANRADRAHLDLKYRGVHPTDATAITGAYQSDPLPLGICSIATQRQNETTERPWIICPKRLLQIRGKSGPINPEVRALIPLPPNTLVRIWWEVKFRHVDRVSNDFFEYTFDYIMVPISRGKAGVEIVGPPFNIEIMTSSTRGGGLTEHMVDVLLQRPQRRLRDIVDSPYTPNYRQVFERMIGQLFAKSPSGKFGFMTRHLQQAA